ncbi:MAG: hypothetical protein IJW49_11430 [Clostridia bacterium]|nr:hypothetical protein [Clostridia bacterium]
MEQAKYPSAEIRCGDNLFAIEYFKTYPEEAERGNPYNTVFSVRVVSGAFCGYASCEYDIKEFIKFANEIEELFLFKRNSAMLNDMCYGGKVNFSADKTGHLEISGEIFGNAAEQRLVFCFSADQTCLGAFVKTVKGYLD